jgi:predicted transcriptional regulator
MISISTRLEEEKIKKIEQIARRMHLEKSALIRKFILIF